MDTCVYIHPGKHSYTCNKNKSFLKGHEKTDTVLYILKWIPGIKQKIPSLHIHNPKEARTLFQKQMEADTKIHN